MNKDLDSIFKIFLMLFFIWIGFCAYKLSQNGRYQLEKPVVIDTHTGIVYKVGSDGKPTIIDL